MKHFSVVAAMDEALGIGRGGGLPWRLSRDMERFREVTLRPSQQGGENALIMGRRTWESLPPRFRPLPGRVNVVLTSRPGMDLPPGVIRAGSLDGALSLLEQRPGTGDIFVIGGGVLYAEAVRHPACEALYLTRIRGQYGCDTFFPAIPERFQLVRRFLPPSEGATAMEFLDYRGAE